MRIDIVSLFPDFIQTYAETSIVGRACRRGLLDLQAQDPRAWAGGRHRVVDDRPYGGGPGMVLAAPPIAACVDAIQAETAQSKILMPTPQGPHLTQQHLQQLTTESHLIILCGHYEGIDERISQLYQPQEFSIGDLVVSGGELPALILADGLARLIPGVLGDSNSAVEDSFSGASPELDHPAYTRPEEFRGLRVPDVLLSGNHKDIEAWRRTQRQERTRDRRPDLLQ